MPEARSEPTARPVHGHPGTTTARAQGTTTTQARLGYRSMNLEVAHTRPCATVSRSSPT